MAGAIKHIKLLAASLGVGTHKAANTAGSFVNMRYTDVIAGPVAAAADTIVTAVAASNAAGGADLTIAAQPDFPRNITITADAAQTEAVTITGTDQFDAAQTEAITFNGAATVAGKKVFKTVTLVHQAQRSGAANISVGTGVIMGTSRKMNSLGIDAAVYTTASGATTAVQETTRPVKAPTANVHGVTFNTDPDPAKTHLLSYGSSEIR